MNKLIFLVFAIFPIFVVRGEIFQPDFTQSSETILKEATKSRFSEFSADFDFQVPQGKEPNSSLSFVLAQKDKKEKYYLMAKFGGNQGEIRIVRKWLREKTLYSRQFTFVKNHTYRFKVYYLGYKAFLKITSPEFEEHVWDLGTIIPLSFDFNQTGLRVYGDVVKFTSGIRYNFQEGESLPKKGGYFLSQRNSSNPPTYEELKDNLPRPQIDNLPIVEEMNDFAWKTMIKNIKRVDPANKLFVSPYIDEAFSPAIFQWDTIFMLFFAKYLYPKFNAIAALDNFYATQTREGKILRVLLEKSGLPEKGSFFNYGVNPPLFSWAEVEWAEYTGDFSRFSRVFPVLEQYAHWLEISRKAQNSAHQLYWNSGLGSGMDNIPIETSENHAWVDMSAQMVLMYKNLSKMAAYL